jgi:chemotaxis protein CheY-P-specific phosphatase CheC/chemotaxis signal transduction protein/two-component sensor histidine kinase
VQNSGFISLSQQMKNGLGKSPQVLELESKTEALTKVSRDLQDGIMKVRMLPVSNVFSRFHRVVRDLARDRRKQVVLDIYGEETEIDKKVMDRIGEPLVHLIRNAIDHGIETVEARRAAGKDQVGRVRLGAYQEGDHICIEVADDGRGLDREAILAKAIERGLFRREDVATLGEQQILEAVFLPGFSTAKEVTDISGRGVGMDVVKRAAEEMGGGVSLRTSPGRGTTVTISLPLTMAIIPAVLVEAAGATLAIPLSSVREIVKLTGDNLHTIGGQGVLRLREEILSLVSLDGALELSGDMSGRSCQPGSPVVIVENDGRRIGLGVDRILHTSEIVIKSLSRHFREIEGLIGASILGSGKIALIVDVEALARACCRGEKETPVAGLEASPVHLASPADAEPAPAAQEEPPAPDSLRQRFEELLRRDRELFEEVHNSGAIQASMALSQLTGKEIRVSFPESEIVRLGDLAGQLGGEDQVVGGIYTALQGELEGAILQVIPCEQLLRYAEVLYHYEEGTLKSIGENELSGLTEMGNIIAASFFNAFADSAGLAVQPTVPEISVDMCQAVIDAVLARFNQPGEEILLTRALIYYNDADRMACHLLIFLDQDSLESLLQAFSRQAGSPAAEQA